MYKRQVETAQEKINSIIVENHVDVSAFDTNNDNNLSGHELVHVWNTLDTASQQQLATSLGYTVDQANQYIDSLTEEQLNDSRGINKLNNDLNITLTHAAGITGEGINIVTHDYFTGESTGHGQTVEGIIQNIASDADFTRVDDPNSELSYEDHTNLMEADIINQSFGYVSTQEELDHYGLNVNGGLSQFDEIRLSLIHI